MQSATVNPMSEFPTCENVQRQEGATGSLIVFNAANDILDPKRKRALLLCLAGPRV